MNLGDQSLKGYQYSMQCVLEVTGEDAQSFLQSQFSNDLSKAEPLSTVYGLWLSIKGRVLADSYIIVLSDNHYWILSEFTEAASIKDMLEKHLIADDVEIGILESFGSIALDEAGSESLIKYLGINATTEHVLVSKKAYCDQSFGIIFTSDRFGSLSREFCFLNKGYAEKLELMIARNLNTSPVLHLIDENQMHLKRIELGRPLVPQEIGPGDLAAEGGFVPSAVSLTKGCYLGQEVVARLHHLGKAQRQLYILGLTPIDKRTDSEQAVDSTNAQVVFGSAELPLSIEYEGRSIGQLRSVYNSNGGAYSSIAIALLKERALDCFKEGIILEGYTLTLIKAFAQPESSNNRH